MKDAKGHGSDARGGGRRLPSVSQVPLGKLPGEAGVQASMARIGAAGQAHVARIAQAHGIQGGPFKVQSLNLKLAGQPFKTVKSFRNNTVAEHVAKYMRTDGGYTRVR